MNYESMTIYFEEILIFTEAIKDSPFSIHFLVSLTNKYNTNYMDEILARGLKMLYILKIYMTGLCFALILCNVLLILTTF